MVEQGAWMGKKIKICQPEDQIQKLKGPPIIILTEQPKRFRIRKYYIKIILKNVLNKGIK
jgi:hypothetical protein